MFGDALYHASLDTREYEARLREQVDDACAYASEAADVTLRVWDALKPQLHQQRVTTVYETLERPLISVLARMELAGIERVAQGDGDRRHDCLDRFHRVHPPICASHEQRLRQIPRRYR